MFQEKPDLKEDSRVGWALEPTSKEDPRENEKHVGDLKRDSGDRAAGLQPGKLCPGEQSCPPTWMAPGVGTGPMRRHMGILAWAP